MLLARVSIGLPCDLTICPGIVSEIQTIIQAILGLQNDLLGWQKDFQTDNPLNAVQVLIRDGGSAHTAYKAVLQMHNSLVRTLVHRANLAFGYSLRRDTQEGKFHDPKAWELYIRVLVNFGNAMAKWMLGSRRYQTMSH